MKAAIYYGPEDIRCGEKADPSIDEPHQILVEVIATSLCGSDLHLYRGAMDPIMERGKSAVALVNLKSVIAFQWAIPALAVNVTCVKWVKPRIAKPRKKPCTVLAFHLVI